MSNFIAGLEVGVAASFTVFIIFGKPLDRLGYRIRDRIFPPKETK